MTGAAVTAGAAASGRGGGAGGGDGGATGGGAATTTAGAAATGGGAGATGGDAATAALDAAAAAGVAAGAAAGAASLCTTCSGAWTSTTPTPGTYAMGPRGRASSFGCGGAAGCACGCCWGFIASAAITLLIMSVSDLRGSLSAAAAGAAASRAAFMSASGSIGGGIIFSKSATRLDSSPPLPPPPLFSAAHMLFCEAVAAFDLGDPHVRIGLRLRRCQLAICLRPRGLALSPRPGVRGGTLGVGLRPRRLALGPRLSVRHGLIRAGPSLLPLELEHRDQHVDAGVLRGRGCGGSRPQLAQLFSDGDEQLAREVLHHLHRVGRRRGWRRGRRCRWRQGWRR